LHKQPSCFKNVIQSEVSLIEIAANVPGRRIEDREQFVDVRFLLPDKFDERFELWELCGIDSLQDFFRVVFGECLPNQI
jgi:hypothetical protein